ncbi:MAG: hypothetical protein ACYS9X_32105 [Planctomycetota bacterium]|jgi:hypothetical protein
MSIGGGAVPLVPVVVGAVLSERRWLRILCRVYAGLYFAPAVGSVAFGGAPASHLIVPLLFLAFGLYVLEVRTDVGAPP